MFANKAGIKLTKRFTKVTPDFLACVPFKEKKSLTFPLALFPTNCCKNSRRKKEKMEKDMQEVSSPPESLVPSPNVSPTKNDLHSCIAGGNIFKLKQWILFEITTSISSEVLESKFDQIEYAVE